MGYEGSPALWHIILKGFIAIGWTYEYYYLIPIIITSIGIAICEFKSDLPIYIKLVLPLHIIFFINILLLLEAIVWFFLL